MIGSGYIYHGPPLPQQVIWFAYGLVTLIIAIVAFAVHKDK